MFGDVNEILAIMWGYGEYNPVIDSFYCHLNAGLLVLRWTIPSTLTRSNITTIRSTAR